MPRSFLIALELILTLEMMLKLEIENRLRKNLKPY